MGRDAGYIALECGISCGANAIAVKELPFDEDACIAKLIELREKGQRSFLVVHSEGMPKGFGENLTERMNKEANIDSRFIRLAHMVRGGSPTLRDRLTATRMGDFAVDLILEGKSNLVVIENDGKIESMDIVFALTTDRMYKNKLKEGDLDKFSEEEIAQMKAICEKRRAEIEELYALVNDLAL
jgi:6-phosphofructokinase 1